MAIADPGEPSINVTPLIDVLLVLLIIFMVVAPTRPAQFETKIPAKPNAETPTARDRLLVVALDATGAVTLNTLSLPLDELEGRLTQELANRTGAERAVIVQAPESFAYGRVVEVLDRVKGAGAGPIGLQIDLLDT